MPLSTAGFSRRRTARGGPVPTLAASEQRRPVVPSQPEEPDNPSGGHTVGQRPPNTVADSPGVSAISAGAMRSAGESHGVLVSHTTASAGRAISPTHRGRDAHARSRCWRLHDQGDNASRTIHDTFAVDRCAPDDEGYGGVRTAGSAHDSRALALRVQIGGVQPPLSAALAPRSLKSHSVQLAPSPTPASLRTHTSGVSRTGRATCRAHAPPSPATVRGCVWRGASNRCAHR